ncbi:MAG: hypothetical protein KBC53_03515 [Nitrosomonas sp.]|nr:hypothetical protein [Nitrosomonas sp.]
MTRGVTTLEQMVSNLRLETYRSNDVALGQDEYPALVRLLQSVQKQLYTEFDWPFLKIRRDVTIAAGQRYYDFPTDLDFERIHSVKLLWSGTWTSLERGITMDDYNLFDSDSDERSDPQIKWDVIDAGSGEQIEVWPMPNTDGNTLRFSGYKSLSPLLADDDVCTLDDDLIVFYAASELLAKDGSPDAQNKLNRAKQLFSRIKSQSNATENMTFSMSGASKPRYPRKQIIAVHDSGV